MLRTTTSFEGPIPNVTLRPAALATAAMRFAWSNGWHG
jgi:hypothetical protein